MPYIEIDDLPAPVRHALPPHAQEIFLGAFNGAWRTYGGAANPRIEEIANRVAWSAVKKSYVKTAAGWVPRHSHD